MQKLNFRQRFWFYPLGNTVNPCGELGWHKEGAVQWWLGTPGKRHR